LPVLRNDMTNCSKSLLSRTLLLSGLLVGMALAVTPMRAQDPPPSNGRLSHLEGNIQVQPNGVDDWDQAGNNMPVGPGDRVFADQGGRGELLAGPTHTYFGPNADLSLVNYNDQGIEFGQAQGSVHYESYGFAPGQSLFISTPNGAVSVPTRADFRIDIYSDQNTTIITNARFGLPLQITGAGGFETQLAANQAIQLYGTNPVNAQSVDPAPWDAFQQWSTALDSRRENTTSAAYVSTEMDGYEDLDGNGDWQADSPYGPIWFPHVQAGWAPYHNGHWVHRPFFGWTWVADEPWGAAPFHYGRWVAMGGRWGWIPGPREAHPVWSPAQVVFAGGIQVGGVGVSAWFPLGPGEAYRPWYPCSPAYIDRVNRSNIRESREVHVQTTYVNVINVTNVTYVNRTNVTVMRQEDFAAGRPAHDSHVAFNPAQFQHVQAAAPTAVAPARPVLLHPVSRPAAISVARPVLINHNGNAVSSSPNARPVAVPIRPVSAPPARPGNAPGRQMAPAAITPGNHPMPAVPNSRPVAQPEKPVTPQVNATTPQPTHPSAPTTGTQPTPPAAHTPPPVVTNPPPAHTPPAAGTNAAPPAGKPNPPAKKDEKKPKPE